MPLLYGEREKAFTRLQEEIAKTHDDDSLFSWSRTNKLDALEISIMRSPGREKLSVAPAELLVQHVSIYPDEHRFSLFARSPADFRFCDDVVPLQNWPVKRRKNVIVRQDTMQIELPLLHASELEMRSQDHHVYKRNNISLALLGCRVAGYWNHLTAVPLLNTETDSYGIAGDPFHLVNENLDLDTLKITQSLQDVVLHTEPGYWNSSQLSSLRPCILISVKAMLSSSASTGYNLTHVHCFGDVRYEPNRFILWTTRWLSGNAKIFASKMATLIPDAVGTMPQAAFTFAATQESSLDGTAQRPSFTVLICALEHIPTAKPMTVIFPLQQKKQRNSTGLYTITQRNGHPWHHKDTDTLDFLRQFEPYRGKFTQNPDNTSIKLEHNDPRQSIHIYSRSEGGGFSAESRSASAIVHVEFDKSTPIPDDSVSVDSRMSW